MRKTLPFILATCVSVMICAVPAAYAQQTAPANNKAAGSGTSTAPAAKPTKPAPNAAPASGAKSSAAPELATQKAKASYAIGLDIGNGLHRDGVDIDPNVFLMGLKDALAQNKPALSEDDMKAALTALQTEVTNRQQAEMEKKAADNKTQGEAFLTANKTKDGVVTLPSGLQYKILTPGTGAKPSPTDTVAVNYRGTLIDGTEFDSSYKRGQPVVFTVNEVIRGWAEALPLMSVGSKWQLFVPAELAYGEKSPAPEIGPNATLIFEVELIDIKKAGDGATPATPPPATAPQGQ